MSLLPLVKHVMPKYTPLHMKMHLNNHNTPSAKAISDFLRFEVYVLGGAHFLLSHVFLTWFVGFVHVNFKLLSKLLLLLGLASLLPMLESLGSLMKFAQSEDVFCSDMIVVVKVC